MKSIHERTLRKGKYGRHKQEIFKNLMFYKYVIIRRMFCYFIVECFSQLGYLSNEAAQLQAIEI